MFFYTNFKEDKHHERILEHDSAYFHCHWRVARLLSRWLRWPALCPHFAMVGIAHVLDANVIGDGSVLRTAVIFFYLSNEGVSLLENAAHLGLPVPEKIKTVLEQLHDRSESEDE